MKAWWLAALGLTVLLASAPVVQADERADMVIEQIQDAIDAAKPLLVDYTLTYTYKKITWQQDCRIVDTGRGGTSRSSYRGPDRSKLAPEDRPPDMDYYFSPLQVSHQKAYTKEVTTRYVGAVSEGQTLYKIIEVTFSPQGPLHPPSMTELVKETWYVGPDDLIHRMKGEIQFTPDDKSQETKIVQVEGHVTTYRKPRETHIDPQSKVKPERIVDTQRGSILAMAYSQDGKRLAFGYYEGLAEVWDTQTWKPLPFNVKHAGLVQSIAFSPNGKMLATASTDKTAKLCDATTGADLHTLTHPDGVASVAFSPDGKHLATAANTTIRIWNATTGALEQTLTGHTGSIVNVAFSPDGKRLASCGWDNTAKLWDTTRWQVVANLVGHTGPVFSVDFSSNSKMLATTSRDGVVKLWDVATGRLLRTIQDEDGPIMALAFTHDGKSLAASYEDKLRDEGSYHPGIKFWDTTTGRSVRTLTSDNLSLTRLVVSPDGSTLLTGGWSRTVQLFALPQR